MDPQTYQHPSIKQILVFWIFHEKRWSRLSLFKILIQLVTLHLDVSRIIFIFSLIDLNKVCPSKQITYIIKFCESTSMVIFVKVNDIGQFLWKSHWFWNVSHKENNGCFENLPQFMVHFHERKIMSPYFPHKDFFFFDHFWCWVYKYILKI